MPFNCVSTIVKKTWYVSPSESDLLLDPLSVRPRSPALLHFGPAPPRLISYRSRGDGGGLGLLSYSPPKPFACKAYKGGHLKIRRRETRLNIDKKETNGAEN